MISEIRTNAVKSYLVGKGIDPARIIALGNGAQRFIASNKTRKGRRMNRRVEIQIFE
jgi:outer membrane protein OmpA-like peptidoglycan-associated protein